MKVYVLIERLYNYESGEEDTSFIDGVYTTKEKAENNMKKRIKDYVENFDFLEDEYNTQETSCKVLFYDFQENWNNHIEIEIIESEVE